MFDDAITEQEQIIARAQERIAELKAGECASHGHDWSQWFDGHRGWPGSKNHVHYRFCNRCSESDQGEGWLGDHDLIVLVMSTDTVEPRKAHPPPILRPGIEPRHKPKG